MKPVAAGVDEALGVNADVAALAAAGNVDAPLADRNPYAFADAIAPHIAARTRGATIDLERVAQAYARLAARADVVSSKAPAAARAARSAPRHARRPRRLALPVVLVVGVRLGCLSHALVGRAGGARAGAALAGWIASRVDPAMAQADASVAALRERLPAPLLADLAGADAPIPREALRLAGLPGETC
jgi:dethiobiotin synthetase